MFFYCFIGVVKGYSQNFEQLAYTYFCENIYGSKIKEFVIPLERDDSKIFLLPPSNLSPEFYENGLFKGVSIYADLRISEFSLPRFNKSSLNLYFDGNEESDEYQMEKGFLDYFLSNSKKQVSTKMLSKLNVAGVDSSDPQQLDSILERDFFLLRIGRSLNFQDKNLVQLNIDDNRDNSIKIYILFNSKAEVLEVHY